MYIAGIKIKMREGYENGYYEKEEWKELFRHKDKVCSWRIRKGGYLEFVLGYYKDRFQALNEGKMLYFNILYRIHRRHSNFELGDDTYISRIYHSEHGYTLKEFIQNEEWFFSTKKYQSNLLGLQVYEIDKDLNDYDKYQNEWNVKLTAEDNKPFAFLEEIGKLDEKNKFSKKTQEIFNLVSLSEKADERTKILLLCQAIETMETNDLKTKKEIAVIEECIEIVKKSDLEEKQKNSMLGLLSNSKKISSREKCNRLIEKYFKNKYDEFNERDVFKKVYTWRSEIIHGEELSEKIGNSYIYYLKIIVLDILKEWCKDDT